MKPRNKAVLRSSRDALVHLWRAEQVHFGGLPVLRPWSLRKEGTKR